MADLQKYHDFLDYVKTTEILYSYKFVLLQCVLRNADAQGRAHMQAVVDCFRAFYRERQNNDMPVEREGAAVNRIDAMTDSALRRLIIENPYRSINKANWLTFEREIFQINPELWGLFAIPDKLDLMRIISERIVAYYHEGVSGDIMDEIHRADQPLSEQLKYVHAYVLAKSFQFTYADLANFYLCLRTKPFVILAGVSGTGKSQLPRLFSEAIGAYCRTIPVRPDWNDGSDLLGYVDLEGKFRPGALLTAIDRCLRSPNIPHIVVLDEMNLARVEHYLSDVLSIMELREHSLAGVSTNPLLENTTFPRETDRELYGSVSFPDNLYIVGTVNMDETTHPFSKKVLDRANTIEFSHIDLAGYRLTSGPSVPSIALSNSEVAGRYLRLGDIPLNQQTVAVIDKLVAINKMLEPAGLHIGYRVRDEIAIYMECNRELGLMTEDEAFDFQLMQKILPRIQGSTQSIRRLLIELLFMAGGADLRSTNDDILQQLGNEFVVGPKAYARSASKIATMLRRFEEDGFTSYWI